MCTALYGTKLRRSVPTGVKSMILLCIRVYIPALCCEGYEAFNISTCRHPYLDYTNFILIDFRQKRPKKDDACLKKIAEI